MWGKHISIHSTEDGQEILLERETRICLRRYVNMGLLGSVELFSLELSASWKLTHLSDSLLLRSIQQIRDLDSTSNTEDDKDQDDIWNL